jgi:ABC-2 type transport system permease protein
MSNFVTYGGIAPYRIGAMILRYWYLLISSWPRLLELLYWPALQIITWGFLQSYISRRCGRAISAT